MANPSLASLTADSQGGFMFFLTVAGSNILGEGVRLFDFYLLQQEFAPFGRLVSSTRVPLQPCTPQHFAFGTEL